MSVRRKVRAAGVLAASVAALIGASAVDAGSAHAAPQLARWAVTGNDFGTLGDHASCRGAVNVEMTSPPQGVVRLTLTSHGFTGSGESWKKDPHCRVVIISTHSSSRTFSKETVIPASFGPRAGQKVSRDVVTGPGLAEFSVVPYAPRTAIRTPLGYGYGAWVLVP